MSKIRKEIEARAGTWRKPIDETWIDGDEDKPGNAASYDSLGRNHLVPDASVTMLTGMPFRTWRQYHILFFCRYCSDKSPRTASVFGPHPKCLKSHVGSDGGRFALILVAP